MTESDPRMQIFPRDDSLARGWDDLGAGVPSLIALAKQASIAMVEGRTDDWRQLSPHARTLLHAARHRGAFEIQATNSAFEPHQRWLVVAVEQPEHEWLVFRPANSPSEVVQFFAGFAELCRGGLVMHQIYRDFSLTPAGFLAAKKVDPAELRALLASAVGSGTL